MTDVSGLVALVSNLGLGAIFLWLFIQERDSKKSLMDKLFDAFIQNTEAIRDMRETLRINTEASMKGNEILEKHNTLLDLTLKRTSDFLRYKSGGDKRTRKS